MTKKILLDEDREKIRLSKDKPFQSYLLPMITSVKVKQSDQGSQQHKQSFKQQKQPYNPCFHIKNTS